jgi:hypothetical protein
LKTKSSVAATAAIGRIIRIQTVLPGIICVKTAVSDTEPRNGRIISRTAVRICNGSFGGRLSSRQGQIEINSARNRHRNSSSAITAATAAATAHICGIRSIAAGICRIYGVAATTIARISEQRRKKPAAGITAVTGIAHITTSIAHKRNFLLCI